MQTYPQYYPQMNNYGQQYNPQQVTACGIKTRTRYATVVHTSADSGTFRLCKRVCCTTNNLRAINGEGTAVAPGPTGGDA